MVFLQLHINENAGETMKKVLLLILLLSQAIFADAIYDLTKPENKTLSDTWPEYKEVRLKNFDDTAVIGGGFENESIVSFQLKNSEKIDKIANVRIDFNRTGRKVLYISAFESCPIKDTAIGTTVLIVSKTNIKFTKLCNSINNVYYTAASPKGRDFIVNEFKTKRYVPFYINDFYVQFDAKGFNEAWSRFGDDAI